MGVFMRLAVIGSRNLTNIAINEYISENVTEIVSGGAIGVDFCAAEYARQAGLTLTEFLPNYQLYGRVAPIVRNKAIVDYADKIIAFGDGSSKGTLSAIRYAEKIGKPCKIVICR